MKTEGNLTGCSEESKNTGKSGQTPHGTARGRHAVRESAFKCAVSERQTAEGEGHTGANGG